MTSSLIASAMLRDPLYHIECLTAPSYTKYLIPSTAPPPAPASQWAAPARSARCPPLQGRLSFSLRAERADARSVAQRMRLRTPLNRAPVERCATLGLRAHPPPDPDDVTVTFLNGRKSDICIWWTHL